MSSEIEFAGVKFKGGRLVAILTALSTLGGGIWGGFEVYGRWQAMEAQIAAYVEPDLSGFNREIGVINETITGLEKRVETELLTLKELLTSAQDSARTIKTDLKADMYGLQDSMDTIVEDNRELNRNVYSKIEEVKIGMQVVVTDARNSLNGLIQHASDRFDAKRTAIEEGAQRRQDFLTDEMKNLEERFGTKLQRALSNPLSGQ
jgi:chromosome segregation ATPase